MSNELSIFMVRRLSYGGFILISIGMIQARLATSYRSIVIWRCLTGIGSTWRFSLGIWLASVVALCGTMELIF